MAKVSMIYKGPQEISEGSDKAFMEGVTKLFPIQGRYYTLKLSSITKDAKSFGREDEKNAILGSSSLTNNVYGDVSLVDNETGKIVDISRKYPLGKVFTFTQKGTVLYKGNNYMFANQLQMLPGVYTRTKNNGVLEAHFNTGSGNSFSIIVEPETGLFYLIPKSSSSKILLFPLLHVLGVPNLQKILGDTLLQKNIEASKGKESQTLRAIYTRLVPKKKQIPDIDDQQVVDELKNQLRTFDLHKETTKITLGKEYDHINPEVFSAALSNLVQVYKGEKEEDNRDSLAFKKVQSFPDFIRSRFEKGAETRDIVRKIHYKMEKKIDHPTIKDFLPPFAFTRVITDFIQTSELAYVPTETNYLESLENVGKVTLLGEGAIPSDEAVPASARGLDPSHFGVLDLNRTPESSHAGIDLRFALRAARDEHGIIYLPVINAKTGKEEHISTQKALQSVIGFPGEEGKVVRANIKGVLGEIEKSKVDYWYSDPSDFYSVTTNLIPFMNSDHPGRLTMAGKALPQSLALETREAPLVQSTTSDGSTFVQKFGKVLSVIATKNGVVSGKTARHVVVSNEDGTKSFYTQVKNLPFNQKGFLDVQAPIVKEGDVVKKGQLISDTNYTKNGDLALGVNMKVAYMPYKGYNFEDGIVISQSASERLLSSHFYLEKYDKSRETVDSITLVKRYFPNKFTPEQLANLNPKGVAIVGKTLKKGDPIIAMLEKRPITPEDKMLGRLNKALIKPFRLVEVLWEHDVPGLVVDSHEGKTVKVSIRAEKPAEVGDKLTGLHGNKGVIALILPDEKMPYTAHNGEKAEVILNPASVTSRVNLGQLLETAAGKIAKKTGKPYLIGNYREKDNLLKVKKDLAAHGLSEADEMIDPDTGKPYPNKIFNGHQYILKLNKTTDQNYSARNTGSYDSNMQPVKGGMEGSKGIGFMEFLAMLGNNARHNLKEMTTVKSEKNEDYWASFVRGEPLPVPNTPFVTSKFFNMLKASGAAVSDDGKMLKIKPMTSKEVLKQSNGEIKKPLMIEAKNLEPETDGLFDISKTGGLHGTKWTHYTLAEPVLNPLFEKAAKKLLGLSSPDFEKLVSGEYKVLRQGKVVTIVDREGKAISNKPLTTYEDLEGELEKESAAAKTYVGGEAFEQLLDFDVDKEAKEVKANYDSSKSKSAKLHLMDRLRFLHGLKNSGFTKPKDAYILRHVPVLPPINRPLLVKGNGNIEYADVNHLYKDHMLVNTNLKELKKDLPDEDLTQERRDLYHGLKAVIGLGDPISPASSKRKLQGLLEQVHGVGGPKYGFFHKKILSKKQDFSGRLTLTGDANLGLNEARIPEELGWTLYKAHGVRNLIRMGYTYSEAENEWEKRTPRAVEVLNRVTSEVPLIVNRAPSLLRTNLIGVYAKPSQVNTLSLNPLTFKGMNADVDGDAISLFLPQTPKAVQEVKEKMLPQYNIPDIRSGAGNVLFAPSHEAVLGAVHMTEPDPEKKTMIFSSEQEVLDALKSGKIEADQPVEVRAKK